MVTVVPPARNVWKCSKTDDVTRSRSSLQMANVNKVKTIRDFWSLNLDHLHALDMWLLFDDTQRKLPSLSITASSINLEKHLTWCVLEQKHFNPPRLSCACDCDCSGGSQVFKNNTSHSAKKTSFGEKVKKCLSTSEVISSDSCLPARKPFCFACRSRCQEVSECSFLVIARHRLKRLYRKVILQINATLSAPPRILLLLCLALTPPHARFSLSLCNEWADGERAVPLTWILQYIHFILFNHSFIRGEVFFFFFQDVPGLILKLGERRDKKESLSKWWYKKQQWQTETFLQN